MFMFVIKLIPFSWRAILKMFCSSETSKARLVLVPLEVNDLPPPLDSGNGSPRLKDMLNFLIALDQSGFKADETIKDTQSKMLQGCLVDLQQTPPQCCTM